MSDPHLPPSFLPTLSSFWQPSFPAVERHLAERSPIILTNIIRLLRFSWLIITTPLHITLVLLHHFSPILAPASLLPGADKRWGVAQRLFYPLLARFLWSITAIGLCPDLGDRFEYAVPLSTRVLMEQLGGGIASVEAETVELSAVARREKWIRAEAVDPAGVVLAQRVPCFWIEVKSSPKEDGLEDEGPLAALEAPPLTSGNARQRSDGGKVVLFLAGGGYVFGHPAETGRCFSVARESGVPVFGVNYRKATIPDRAFPGALLDAIAGYSHLVALGFDQIILAGDSAGGGLAMTLLLYLTNTLALAEGGPPPSLVLPVGVMLYSPWLDLTLAHCKVEVQTDYRDDILNPSALATAATHYLSHLIALPDKVRAAQETSSPTRMLALHPFLSPALSSSQPVLDNLAKVYADSGKPLKLLVFSGGAEMFAPEIRALVRNLKRANASVAPSGMRQALEVEVVEEKDEIHCYVLMPSIISPAAGRAIKKVGEFLEGI